MLLDGRQGRRGGSRAEEGRRAGPRRCPHPGRVVRFLRPHASSPAEARETLQTIAKNEKLNKAQRASILAQGYELLGDKEQAEASYREAARLEPDDAAAQLRLARYLLRTGSDRSTAEAGAIAPRRARALARFQPRAADAGRVAGRARRGTGNGRRRSG